MNHEQTMSLNRLPDPAQHGQHGLRRTLLRGVAVAATTGGLLLGLAGMTHAETKLKFAHVYEVSEPYHTAAVWAAGEIAKRTSNRYAMEVFPASSLGKETDINQGMALGTIDICRAAAAKLPS
jgi:TRAP-type C4-dicarboxylate transport system substrate-binding protein